MELAQARRSRITPRLGGHAQRPLPERAHEAIRRGVASPVQRQRLGQQGVQVLQRQAARGFAQPRGVALTQLALGHDEIEQVRAADTAGVPVLGICFGGQVLAAAHGGSVERAAHAEIGWTDVHSVDVSVVPHGPWFQWHFDRWVTPPDAELLASNGAAPQAFALRRNLAVQFHPELTGASLVGWLENGGFAGAREAGFDPGMMLTETDRIQADAARRAALLVDGFLDRIAVR